MAISNNKTARDLIGQAQTALRSLRLKPIETLFLVATLAFASVVVYFYVFEVRARRVELDGLDARDRAAHSRILEAGAKKKKLEAQRSNASLIIDSIQSFERRLKNREQGTSAIISEVNNLAKQHRALAGDYSYRVIEGETDNQANQAPSSQRVESLNAYTALGIETTVVGDYGDLRRLISAIERSQQFIVINSVAFQGEADRPGLTVVPAGLPAVLPAVQQRSVPATGEGGIPVSLKIEMETYFRNGANSR